MSKPYDALGRILLENHPDDWVALLRLTAGRHAPARVVNADLSTVTAEADKVLRLDEPVPWLVHIELQSSYDKDLPRRLLRYNALLNVRHDLPVHSVVVLLFPDADGPALDGVLRQQSPDGRCRVEFHYQVVRVWELAPEALAGGLGTLPLAVVALPSAAELPGLVERMKATLAQHPTRDEGELWACLYILIGKRFQDVQLADRLLGGIEAMEDSVTYRELIRRGEVRGRIEGRREGQIEGARAILLRQGTLKLGEPSQEVRARIEAIETLPQLEELAARILMAGNWDELLANGAQPTR